MFEGFVRKCSRVPFEGFVRKCSRVPFEGFVRKCSRVPFEGFVRFEGFLKMAFSTSGLVKVFCIFQAFPRPLVKFEEFGTCSSLCWTGFAKRFESKTSALRGATSTLTAATSTFTRSNVHFLKICLFDRFARTFRLHGCTQVTKPQECDVITVPSKLVVCGHLGCRSRRAR